MSGIKVRPLGSGDLAALPMPCRACVFWQSTHGARGGADPDPKAKEAWWQATLLECGAPGRGAWDGDDLVGLALTAPPKLVPRSRVVGPAPSDDALLLLTLWVADERRRNGVATTLVQATLRDVHTRRLRALEAYVLPGWLPRSWSCTLPRARLEQLGFVQHRTAGGAALYRLDLRATARWHESVERAIGGVLGVLGRSERRRPALEASRAGQSAR